MIKLRWHVVPPVVALALFAAGCDMQPAANPSEPATGTAMPQAPTSTNPTPQPDALLVDTVHGQQETWYLRRVEDELVRRCMEQRGLRYFTSDIGPMPTDGVATVDVIASTPTNGYGLYERAKAGAAGEVAGGQSGGRADGGLGAPSRNRQDLHVQSLRPADRTKYMADLEGPPSARATVTLPTGSQITFPAGGCRGDARREIYGDIAAAARLDIVPQDVLRQVASRAQSDPEYATALTAWQGCMRRAGHAFRSPFEATTAINRTYRERGATEATRQHELAVARADAACDGSSHLRAVSARMRVKYLEQMSDEIERDLLGLAELRRNAVARAKSLLRTG